MFDRKSWLAGMSAMVLGLASIIASSRQAATAAPITFTGTAQFVRQNSGPNRIGQGLGDFFTFGHTGVAPNAAGGTTGTATQGVTTFTLTPGVSVGLLPGQFNRSLSAKSSTMVCLDRGH